MEEDNKLFKDSTVIYLKTIYGAVFCVGFLANIVTCTSMLYRRIRLPIHVYTLHLSVCDIFMLCFYVPTQMVLIEDQLRWNMGLVVCKMVNIVLPVTLTCTVGTLLAINLDSVIVLARHPDFFSSKIMTNMRNNSILTYLCSTSVKRAHMSMIVIWGLSFIINIPLIIYAKVEKYGEMLYCSEGFSSQRAGEIFWITMFVMVFCLPLICLIASYVSLSYFAGKLRKRSERKFHQKITNLGIVLVVVFAFCTGFQHIFFFVMSSFSTIVIDEKLSPLLFVLANLFVVLQAAVNPFIYGKFRHVFLQKKKVKKTQTPSHLRVERRRRPDGTELLYIKNNKRQKNRTNVSSNTVSNCSDHSHLTTRSLNSIAYSDVMEAGPSCVKHPRFHSQERIYGSQYI